LASFLLLLIVWRRSQANDLGYHMGVQTAFPYRARQPTLNLFRVCLLDILGSLIAAFLEGVTNGIGMVLVKRPSLWPWHSRHLLIRLPELYASHSLPIKAYSAEKQAPARDLAATARPEDPRSGFTMTP
jgi:hypothetical protein